MQKLKIAGILSEVNDYSPFVQSILRIKIDEMAKYLKGQYGSPDTKTTSSVGKDILSFSIRKDINDVFGWNYHHSDIGYDCFHHFTIWAGFEFGKGKKNEGKNNFKVFTEASIPDLPNSYYTENNPYYVLYPKIGKGHIVEFEQGFSTDEFIADPIKFAKQIESAIDATIQRIKDAWIELHEEQTGRDIDLMEVPDIITSAFAKQGVPVTSEFKNSLSYAAIHVTTEYNPEHVGFMILHYNDKGRWEITEASGEFNFVGDLFDIRNDKYDRRKKDIKFEKMGELMEIIAKQYLFRVNTKIDFEAKLNDYMICWTKGE